jgi:hypothetical protein
MSKKTFNTSCYKWHFSFFEEAHRWVWRAWKHYYQGLLAPLGVKIGLFATWNLRAEQGWM